MEGLTLSRRAQLFESDLEEQVKRYDSDWFAIDVVERLSYYGSAKQPILAIPHRAAHAIEANCAYRRNGRTARMDDRGYRKILNVFHAHEDHGLLTILNRDFHLFFLCMYRQQIELQQSFVQRDLSRWLRLFVRDDPIPKLSAEFARKNGLSIADWLKTCFSLFATCVQSPSHNAVVPSGADFGDEALNRGLPIYLREASASVTEIGSRYRQVRANRPPEQLATIRSGFWNTPLLRYSPEWFLAPFPNVLCQHGASSLYAKLKLMSGFDKEFGASFERYVGSLLAQLPGDKRIVCARELKEHAPGKHCDFLVELEREIVLVEAKAAIFSRQLLTPETIERDNSTKKVTQALVQLSQALDDLEAERLATTGVRLNGRSVCRLVVTFGPIVFANSDWYQRSFVEPRLHGQGGGRVENESFPKPIVLSVSDLELLVGVLRAEDGTCVDLLREKASLPYLGTGDWNAFLENRIRSHQAKGSLLPHVSDDWNQFFRGFERG